MTVVGLFGISNDGLNLAVNLLIVLLVIVYLALIVWTFLDARRRIDDAWLVACATAASLFPFVGAMVYSILRPPEFIEDREERELEIRAAKLRVKQLGEQSCPNCEHPVERNYLRCPNCEARLKDPCPSCSKPIDPRWAMCPYCESPTRARSSERRQRSSRRGRSERQPPSRDAREAAKASRERESPRSGRERDGSREPRETRERTGEKRRPKQPASKSEAPPRSTRKQSSDGGAAERSPVSSRSQSRAEAEEKE